MSLQKITELLEGRLQSWADDQSISIAHENLPFTPNGSDYLQSKVIPAKTETVDLQGKSKIYTGAFQIEVCAPIGTGKQVSLALVDQLASYFALNIWMAKAGMTLYVNSVPSALPSVVNAVSYIIPLSVSYRADTLDM